jgi:hypothetical protein
MDAGSWCWASAEKEPSIRGSEELHTLIVGIVARNRLTAFVAVVAARHAFALTEGSTTGQRQKRTVGHDKPDMGYAWSAGGGMTTIP